MVCFSGNKCPGWPSEEARAGLAKSIEELESKWLPPNSLLVVRAEGASHGVSAVTVGDRVIAKYVLTASPVKLQAWYDNLDSYRDMAQP